MDAARGRGLEFADVRLRRSAGAAILVQDGRVRQASSGSSAGAGVRTLVDGAWGSACVDSLEEKALFRALDEAAAVAREVARSRAADGRPPARVARPGVIDREADDVVVFAPSAPSLDAKAARLLALEDDGRRSVRQGAVVSSSLSYADGEVAEVIANTFGTVVSQRSARSSVTCTMVARDGGLNESWTEKAATPEGCSLLETISPEETTIRAAREAFAQTRAAPPPGGRMPVIFDPSMTGLVVHELLGHAVEADLLLRGHSILDGRMGERIASDLVTVVDDPTLPSAWGGYRYDSEGVPAERVTLVEAGVLSGQIESLETAARTGRPPNGHGRSEGVLARPIPRMSNTFLVPGRDGVDEMIRGIERGILLTHGASGYAMSERGQFSCEADRGYPVEHGSLGEPVRHVAVSGEIIEALESIDRVGSEFRLCDPGFCGKDGQEVAVDNGGPHVRVTELLVGGEGERERKKIVSSRRFGASREDQ
jgi:TldD protein